MSSPHPWSRNRTVLAVVGGEADNLVNEEYSHVERCPGHRRADADSTLLSKLGILLQTGAQLRSVSRQAL